jgi:hypothetical protein
MELNITYPLKTLPSAWGTKMRSSLPSIMSQEVSSLARRTPVLASNVGSSFARLSALLHVDRILGQTLRFPFA